MQKTKANIRRQEQIGRKEAEVMEQRIGKVADNRPNMANCLCQFQWLSKTKHDERSKHLKVRVWMCERNTERICDIKEHLRLRLRPRINEETGNVILWAISAVQHICSKMFCVNVVALKLPSDELLQNLIKTNFPNLHHHYSSATNRTEDQSN